jgi:hypothetical protein
LIRASCYPSVDLSLCCLAFVYAPVLFADGLLHCCSNVSPSEASKQLRIANWSLQARLLEIKVALRTHNQTLETLVSRLAVRRRGAVSVEKAVAARDSVSDEATHECSLHGLAELGSTIEAGGDTEPLAAGINVDAGIVGADIDVTSVEINGTDTIGGKKDIVVGAVTGCAEGNTAMDAAFVDAEDNTAFVADLGTVTSDVVTADVVAAEFVFPVGETAMGVDDDAPAPVLKDAINDNHANTPDEKGGKRSVRPSSEAKLAHIDDLIAQGCTTAAQLRAAGVTAHMLNKYRQIRSLEEGVLT